jgi:hypothetical protein
VLGVEGQQLIKRRSQKKGKTIKSIRVVWAIVGSRKLL